MRAACWWGISVLVAGCDCGTWVWGGGEAVVTFSGGALDEPRAWVIPGAEQDVVDRVGMDPSGQLPTARGALVALSRPRAEPARYGLRAARMLTGAVSPCADGDRLLEVNAVVELDEEDVPSAWGATMSLSSRLGDGEVRTLDTGDLSMEQLDDRDTRWEIVREPAVWRESGGSLYACELVEPERVDVHWDLDEGVRAGGARSCEPLTLFDFSIGL